jgi:COP9 signalosome complex subunit 6
MLLLQPKAPLSSQSLPIKVYEPTVEIRERRSRTVFIDVPYTVETGEAERIAVDFTGKGNDGTASRLSSSIFS